jgi:hypothetical protein
LSIKTLEYYSGCAVKEQPLHKSSHGYRFVRYE